MKDFSFNKNNFDIKKFNSVIEDYCSENSVSKDDFLKMQLLCEEFLSNILFPNFDGEVSFLITKAGNNLTLSFVYEGENYMNKFNEQTILSQKILRNKTKEINFDETNSKTNIKFVM